MIIRKDPLVASCKARDQPRVVQTDRPTLEGNGSYEFGSPISYPLSRYQYQDTYITRETQYDV